MFVKDKNGEWKQLGNTIHGMHIDQFGNQLAMNKDGTKLAVTSYGSDPDSKALNMDFVSIFNFTDQKEWKKLGEKMKKDRASEGFPISVGLNENGTTVLFGHSNMNEIGIAYGEVVVFKIPQE